MLVLIIGAFFGLPVGHLILALADSSQIKILAAVTVSLAATVSSRSIYPRLYFTKLISHIPSSKVLPMCPVRSVTHVSDRSFLTSCIACRFHGHRNLTLPCLTQQSHESILPTTKRQHLIPAFQYRDSARVWAPESVSFAGWRTPSSVR